MKQKTISKNSLRVADEVWVTVATLHRNHPEREDFSISEIMEQAESACLTGASRLRPGVKVHVYLHCVANKPPNPGRYRMLYETSTGRRRLFRLSDPNHPDRAGAKEVPKRDELPESMHRLLDWYATEYAKTGSAVVEDPILSLRGVGKAVWEDEDADDYVRRQREGWG